MREIRFVDDTQPAEVKAALALVEEMFWEYEAPVYSREGVGEFCDYIEYDSIIGMLAEGSLVMLCCYENKQLCGVVALRAPNHISLLFVDKRFHRRGIAKALVQKLADVVPRISGKGELTVNSSPYAVPIYQRMGFVPTGEQETVNGITFTPMSRTLVVDLPLPSSVAQQG